MNPKTLTPWTRPVRPKKSFGNHDSGEVGIGCYSKMFVGSHAAFGCSWISMYILICVYI